MDWRADLRAGRRVRQQELAELALGGPVGLVAGRRRVGQIVRDLVLADLLGEHAGGGDVEATVHGVRVIGRRRGDLSVRFCGADPAGRWPDPSGAGDAPRDRRRTQSLSLCAILWPG